MTQFLPAETFPPGDFLQEELTERGWTEADFAERSGCSAQVVHDIIIGRQAVTPEIAVKIAGALGTSPGLWRNLESAYQTWLARQSGDA